MLENKIRRLWEAGQPVLNGWASMPSPIATEVMAAQGYDSLCIDMQHGLVDHQAAIGMLQALHGSGVAPLVRAEWLEPAAIMKPLDAGALGIICPMIETADDVRRFVSYARYEPLGTRSFGPSRALVAYGSDYPERANDEVLCIAMIETKKAFANLDEIVAVEGLDAVYIGPSDLTLSLHHGRLPPGFDREEAEMLEAIERIRVAAHAAGRRAAIHCGSAAYATRAIEMGFDMVTLPNDIRMLASAALTVVNSVRDSIADID